MAVNLTGSITVLLNYLDQRTSVVGAANDSGQRSGSVNGGWTIASGTGAGQADKVWSDTRTVTTGATDTLDLAGTLIDSFGVVTTFVKVKAWAAVAAATNTTTLSIGRPAANGSGLFLVASSGLGAVGFGGIIGAWADPQAGITIAAGSTDLIQVVNSAGASASYTIAILGTSA